MAFVKNSTDLNYRLPRTIPPYWQPKETVVARLTHDGAGGLMNFRLEDAEIYDVGDPVALIRDLNGANPTSPNHTRPPVAAAHPMEIWVRDPCYVVVMLERNGYVRFRAGGPAITSKEDYSDDNCALVHVSADYKILPDRAPGPDCYFAYFSLYQRGKWERQSFNFHLELWQDKNRGWLEISIDPDIPDDGGGVPFPVGPKRAPRQSPKAKPKGPAAVRKAAKAPRKAKKG